MEPTLDRKLKRRRMGSPEGRDDKIRGGRPGKIIRKPTMTLGMQARLRERQARKMRQQGSRMRQEDRVAGAGGYMTGGQAKIAAKAPPPNKIDAKDFAVLRAEKAKGRGQGLQDEKLKPGKVIKAGLGSMILGKKRSSVIAPVGMGAQAGAGAGRQGLGSMGLIMRLFAKAKKDGLLKAKMGKAVDYRKFLDGLKKATNEVNYNRAVMKRKAMEKAKDIGGFAKRAAKASKYGKIAAGVATVGLVAKEYLKKKMDKPKKKMGGGMMQRPIMGGYKTGKMIKAKGCKLGRSKPTKMY